MEIILKRIAKKSGYTIGRLYILEDGEVERQVVCQGASRAFARQLDAAKLDRAHYVCDTLEPTWRNLLGIPLGPGEEDARLGRMSGKRAQKMRGTTAIPEGTYPLLITQSPRFGAWLPLVQGVPGFSGIRIHAGNTARDTQGCILPGENRKVGMVLNSRIWLHRIIARITEALGRDESVWITIV